FVWFERKAGQAAFQLWAGSRVTHVEGEKDTYAEIKLSVPHAIAFRLGMRVNTPEPEGAANPKPRGTAGYVVVADDGDWVEEKYAKYKPGAPRGYGDQADYTWLNPKARKVIVIAVPHNVVKDGDLDEAVKDLMRYARRRVTGSSVLYPPLSDRKSANVNLNGRTAIVGHDQERGKLVVGYRWDSAIF